MNEFEKWWAKASKRWNLPSVAKRVAAKAYRAGFHAGKGKGNDTVELLTKQVVTEGVRQAREHQFAPEVDVYRG